MGGFHSVAISEYGIIFTWRYNQYRQLGLGDNKHGCIPTEVQAASHPILPGFPFSLRKLIEFELFSDLTIFGKPTPLHHLCEMLQAPPLLMGLLQNSLSKPIHSLQMPLK
jgi:hypothetical protein